MDANGLADLTRLEARRKSRRLKRALQTITNLQMDGEGRTSRKQTDPPHPQWRALTGNGEMRIAEEEPQSGDAGAASRVDHPTRDEIIRDVLAYYQVSNINREFADAPSREFIVEEFFDFDYLKRFQEVEHYWVNKPYAYVSVLESEGRDDYRYHVHEPALNAFERYVRDDLVTVLRNKLMYQDLPTSEEREAVFEQKVKDIISDSTIPDGSLWKLKYYLLRDFVHYGSIDPIMRDESIEDISCDGVDVPIYVYHSDYRDLQTNVTFSEQQLNSYTLQLAQRAGEQLSVSDPLMDGSLPDGSRVQATLGGDVSTRGSNFTIRKFEDIPLTPIDLVEFGTFSVEQMAYFWLAIENNRSLIFCGGTGSGKTTSMNAVSFFIPSGSKVVSIEDTRELTLPHDNWVQQITRSSITSDEQGEISMYELLQSSLRQRPEYLLVGEIRTDDRVAFTFFQAINTGHTAYTTMHADTMSGVIDRLTNPPLNLPTQMIQDLDIISIQKQTFKDGHRIRRNQQVTELLPSDRDPDVDDSELRDDLHARNVFKRNAEADTIDRTNDSTVLQDIADQRGWSNHDLERELRERAELLEHLVDNDVSDYKDVVEWLRLFEHNREWTMELVRDGDITVEEDTLDGIASIPST